MVTVVCCAIDHGDQRQFNRNSERQSLTRDGCIMRGVRHCPEAEGSVEEEHPVRAQFTIYRQYDDYMEQEIVTRTTTREIQKRRWAFSRTYFTKHVIHSTARIWRQLSSIRNLDHTVLRFSMIPVLYPIGTPVNGRTFFAPLVTRIIVIGGPFFTRNVLIGINKPVFPARVQCLSVRIT